MSFVLLELLFFSAQRRSLLVDVKLHVLVLAKSGKVTLELLLLVTNLPLHGRFLILFCVKQINTVRIRMNNCLCRCFMVLELRTGQLG